MNVQQCTLLISEVRKSAQNFGSSPQRENKFEFKKCFLGKEGKTACLPAAPVSGSSWLCLRLAQRGNWYGIQRCTIVAFFAVSRSIFLDFPRRTHSGFHSRLCVSLVGVWGVRDMNQAIKPIAESSACRGRRGSVSISPPPPPPPRSSQSIK